MFTSCFKLTLTRTEWTTSGEYVNISCLENLSMFPVGVNVCLLLTFKYRNDPSSIVYPTVYRPTLPIANSNTRTHTQGLTHAPTPETHTHTHTDSHPHHRHTHRLTHTRETHTFMHARALICGLTQYGEAEGGTRTCNAPQIG